MRALARKSNISPGYLPLILGKKRALSANALQKILPHLGLKTAENTYLELLRRLGTSDSQTVRQEALKQMQQVRDYRQLNGPEINCYQYLTQWYYVAIREMANLKHFQWDADWIQSQLHAPVPRKEIEKAMTFLVENGYLKKRGQRYVPTDAVIDCEGGVYRLALGKFHHDILEQSVELLERLPSKQRYVLGYTMALPESKLPKVIDILNDAVNKLEALEKEAGPGDSVYHVGFTSVPLTKGGSNES